MSTNNSSRATLTRQLDSLREYRRSVWPTLAALAEPQLNRPATWRKQPTDVRYLLLPKNRRPWRR